MKKIRMYYVKIKAQIRFMHIYQEIKVPQEDGT